MLAFFSGFQSYIIVAAIAGLLSGGGMWWFRDKLCDATAAQAKLAQQEALVKLMAGRIEAMLAVSKADAERAAIDSKQIAELQKQIDAIPADNPAPCLDEKAADRLRGIR